MAAELSARQKEILDFLADGKRYADITFLTGMKRDYVKNLGHQVIDKLNAESMPHAIAIAFREGLLQ